MKILTLCQGGACRSVALARVLKDTELHPKATHDAIPASWRWNDKATIGMLCAWADLVVVMQSGGLKYVPEMHRHKLKVCDVGPDRWGSAIHPELVKLCQDWAMKEGLLR